MHAKFDTKYRLCILKFLGKWIRLLQQLACTVILDY